MKKRFDVFTDSDRKLDLIRVVDHLVCGHKPNSSLSHSFDKTLAQLVQKSFELAALCTNYMPPEEKRVSVGMVAAIAEMTDMSMGVWAKCLVLPKSRYDILNNIFACAAQGINAAAQSVVVEVAEQPYLPIKANRDDYNRAGTKSMLSENCRGIWYFQEHREVA